jgi:dienelactone hydrolase
MSVGVFREDPSAGAPYRKEYLASVRKILQKLRDGAEEKRRRFITPESLARDREGYRNKYYEMLGAPLTEYAALRDTPVLCLENTPVTTLDSDGEGGKIAVSRMRLAVLGDYEIYGLLFLPERVGKETPFVISQHGGAGTPELCSDFYGDTNYNHQTRRVLDRGAVVFAPQLLLWSVPAYGEPYDRAAVDAELAQFGSSITALEVFGLMRCLDYFVGQPYCNAERIGMIGLSYGGFYTMMTAAADVRIRSAYASCSFEETVGMAAFYDWKWKNSGHMFDEAEIAALIAPRAVCFDAGDRDELFGSGMSKKEYAAAKPFFEAQGVGEKIMLKCFDGGHELDPADDCMDFFFKYLAGSPAETGAPEDSARKG